MTTMELAKSSHPEYPTPRDWWQGFSNSHKYQAIGLLIARKPKSSARNCQVSTMPAWIENAQRASRSKADSEFPVHSPPVRLPGAQAMDRPDSRDQPTK